MLDRNDDYQVLFRDASHTCPNEVYIKNLAFALILKYVHYGGMSGFRLNQKD